MRRKGNQSKDSADARWSSATALTSLGVTFRPPSNLVPDSCTDGTNLRYLQTPASPSAKKIARISADHRTERGTNTLAAGYRISAGYGASI